MIELSGLTSEEAREFAACWLPAWTGNDPVLLASFYTDDAFYADPAIPAGVTGKDDLLYEVFFDRSPLLAALRESR